jgi:hypothetical protein
MRFTVSEGLDFDQPDKWFKNNAFGTLFRVHLIPLVTHAVNAWSINDGWSLY